MVSLERVSKSFGELNVLSSIDLTIGRGEFVSLVGASGSGKTTLLRIVAGLEDPTSGEVRVASTQPDVARRAKHIGLVPQSPALLEWRNVYDNARLLLDLNPGANRQSAAHRGENTSTRQRVMDLLDAVGLAGFAQAYPRELSGGMRQRVALVRAFALDAPLLLLDEPFGALDEITRADMRHLLARLCDATQASVLFVTHSLTEAVYLSDRVGVLTDRPGRLAVTEPVTLGRPRTPDTEDEAAFFDIVRSLRHELHAARDTGRTER